MAEHPTLRLRDRSASNTAACNDTPRSAYRTGADPEGYCWSSNMPRKLALPFHVLCSDWMYREQQEQGL
eukprot:scaffold86_cov338-Pavlova_lutheri.AAC.42